MNEERRIILEMLQKGDVSLEEAERLLSALGEDEAAGGGNTSLMVAPQDRPAPRRISVRVSEHGRTKVNVKIPFSLVRIGLKLGQSFGALSAKYSNDEDTAKALALLGEIDVDELLASIHDDEITLPYTIVDVDDEVEGHVLVVLE